MMRMWLKRLVVMLPMAMGIALLLIMVIPSPSGACDDCACWTEPGNDGGIWYLREDNQLTLDKPDTLLIPDGILIYPGQDAWWYYSDSADGQVIYPEEDHWTLWIRYGNLSGGTLTVTVYSVSSDQAITGIPLATKSYDIQGKWLPQCAGITLEDNKDTNQEIDDGHMLALKLSFEGGKTLALYDSSYACSRLEGAAPLPEWSTLILMSLGLLGLGGYACFRIKRRRTAVV